MVNKKILFISIFVFMIVLSIGAVSAQDADDAVASSDDATVLEDSESVSGTASGGVDVVTTNPGAYSGELSYDIPSDAKTIKSADVYVNIYGGSAEDTYGVNANITLTTDNGVTKYNESLCKKSTTDGTIYDVNNHTTKVYSDYMIHYNVTGLLTGLNGTKLTVKVDTFNYTGKLFDGKIKLIALVLAYNDDSTDETISYWINSTQLWSKQNVTLTFDTKGKSGVSTLTNVVLSSTDGSYKINDKPLGDCIAHSDGSKYYYKYNKWDVTNLLNSSTDTTLNVANNGASIKNVLSVLTIYDVKANISMLPEYVAKSGGLITAINAFAGTNNTLKVTVSPSKAGKYTLRLLADGEVVNETETELTIGSQDVFITDPTIRAVDNTTANGADNKKVNYTVELLVDGAVVNSTSINPQILYNGYLGKDLAYPAGGMEAFPTIIINGDIKIDVQDVSTNLGSSNMTRTDIWTVNLDENSTIVKSFIYVPYNWFKQTLIDENLTMFNTTFNGVKVTPFALYRDQSNLGGGSGKYGYGVLIYDVTDLVNKSGENKFVLNKTEQTPSVYPSVLVYMYNTTNSNYIKEIYINHGADILSDHSTSLFNYANRPVKADSTIKVNPKVTANATLYVFASNALPGYGNIVFNGETYENVWDGATYCTEYKQFDVTGKIKDTNSISVVGTSGTLLALNQIMVLTKNLDDVEITLTPEYTISGALTAYAGTDNAITITIEALKEAKYNATLLADGKKVNSTEISLVVGTNKFILIDPTIREVNASTVNGALNKRVNYTLQLSVGDKNVTDSTIVIPILYNGNLGKDLAYPAGGMESFLNITINGDIVIDAKDASTKLGSSNMTRTDVWAVNLDADSSIVKSYIYVPYNWFNPNKGIPEDLNMFNTTFNGVKVTPIALYRDQGNLGGYGKYGYGVLVYDVTNLTKAGQNSFVLNKLNETPSVYPSVLIYMYNTTGRGVIKSVYISNGADLLSKTTGNVAGRTVKADSTINVTAIADSAKLYVFASNAMNNYGNLVFNGQTYENIWKGASYSTEVFELDITNSVKNSNDISFVATGSTILALQQIIVITQKADIPADEAINVTNPTDTKTPTYSISLPKEATGNFTVAVDGKVYETKELVNGSASITVSGLAAGTYNISISYSGDDNYSPITKNTTVTIKDDKPVPPVVKKATKITAKKKTFKAKKKVKKYAITLKSGKTPVKKVQVTLKIGKKTFKAKTNAKGKAVFKIKKLTKKGKYKAKITFKGNENYKACSKKVKITLK